jgi:hypothetical protein
MSQDDPPLSDAQLAKLKLIIGDTADTVHRANTWCQQHGAEIEFEDGRYTCSRGGQVLATARDLGVLVGKLERLTEGGTDEP